MRRLLAVLLTCWMAMACRGVAAVLVSVGEVWQFTNSASIPPGTPWTTVGFDSSQWASGPSGFGTVTYGEQTSLQPFIGDWRHVVFRKEFVLPDTNGLGAVLLRIDYRDGFVAYLNGREVARRNLTLPQGTPVPLDAIPRSRLSGNPEDIRIGNVAELLVRGTNVLAIQTHSDQTFERPILVPELVSDFSRNPYLQIRGTNTMTVLWHTIDSQPGRLYFGTATNPPLAFEFAPSTNLWKTLTNLIPGQRYHYSVATVAPNGTEIRTPVQSFKALPDRGPVEFAVLGDSGAGTAGQFNVARTLDDRPVDVVLHAGDIIYPYFTEALSDTRLLSVYRDQMATTPFAFSWGNHDLTGGTRALRNVMYPPPNGTPEETHTAEGTTSASYYSFDVGEVHVAVVFQPVLSQYTLRTNSAQYLWLDDDLARTTKPWKILIAHHPIATSGGHRFSDYNANGMPDWAEFATVLQPLARKHGVQLYISGHDHVFERFLPVDGLHAFITGGGGTPLYYLLGYDAISAQLYITHHFARLAADAHTLRVEAVLPGGTVFERFLIQRTPPGPGPFPAGWLTPIIEPPGANNGDGNITRQTFDLAAAPEIRPLTGLAANLGTVHVALDKTHLYLGLASVLVPADTDVCLFLETPALSGVASLAGLGNGIPDANGEGVDALDGMENLAFGEFRPSIAVIVGDEFADGTQRGFRRPGHLSGLGQGVFLLAPGLPEIPGARLQQFNRSPQDNAAPPEQNADFIEIAIPRASLGNLAGNTLRLGIVAAGAPDPIRQTRRLDTAFLGSRFTSDGFGPAVLEGVTIQLPADPDPDNDGLTDAQESTLGTNPRAADTDGDGLPDGWEVTHQLDPLGTDGPDGSDGDPDEDGFANETEFMVGTSPQDPSRPTLTLRSRRQAGGRVMLQWPALRGSMDLQRAPTPSGPWVSHPGFPRERTAAVEEVEITPTEETGFFRVRSL